jgi:outer membrane murein-binding lipoprotein Lpp
MRQPRLTVIVGAITGAVLLASCTNPRTEANVAQALNDAATEISGLKNDIADLQAQLDSLHTIVMKQDTTISRLAEVNHIPVAR